MSVGKGLKPIHQKRYVNPAKDWRRIKTNLEQYESILNQFDADIDEVLHETNGRIVKRLCRMLNIQTPIVEDFPTDKTSSARIIELCQHYNCDTYLSGPSGKNYLDMSMFEANNVEVIFQCQMRDDKRHTLDVL